MRANGSMLDCASDACDTGCGHSRVLTGSLRSFVPSLDRLRCSGGRGLTVAVLGASISCGSSGAAGADKGRAPCKSAGSRLGAPQLYCKEEAWPAFLEEMLNARWPCVSGRHTVANLCQAGVGSDYWSNRIAAWLARGSDDALHPLMRADLVVVETANNDISTSNDNIKRTFSRDDEADWKRTAKSGTHAWTELLVRVLLSLPRAPALVWLTASWRGFLKPPNFNRSATHSHKLVLQHYDIAQVRAANPSSCAHGFS